MEKKLKLILFSIVIFIFSFNFVYSSVEVFSNYDTRMSINTNNSIEINKSLTLKNIYDVGIVPGQIEFKVGRGTEGSVSKIKINNVIAIDSFGNKIKTQVRETKDYTVIIMDVYYPLLPGFEYSFNLYYTMDYKPGGIFFKSLQIPLRESTIPIEKGKFEVTLPNNYYFTYLNSQGINGSIENNIATWSIKDNLPNDIIFEYSYLPINFGGIKGSYLFWIIINMVLLLILVYEIRKEIKRIRAEYQ